MKNKIVLDSCVFNKLFLDEPDREHAINLIDTLTKQKYKTIVPSLFLYEVLAVEKINSIPAEQIYDIIVKCQDLGFQLIELEKPSIEKSLQICEVGHEKSGFPSFYDACYHALAILNDGYFITADKRHFNKTQQLGHIVLLRDWESIL